MNEVRRRAAWGLLLASVLMAPIWIYAWMLDYGPPGMWRAPDALVVGALTPGFLAFLRSGYALIFGKTGPFPLFGPKPADW